ncbi:protein lifeguard 1 [Aplysia californica]|uniref:Protein lifeguard 1 n=1 Tax=Aplysia californica TaxID=6500 RepID=A0ABM1A0Z6_APLCA|nr:protein lifeguard 1 [Aplysia californica]
MPQQTRWSPYPGPNYGQAPPMGQPIIPAAPPHVSMWTYGPSPGPQQPYPGPPVGPPTGIPGQTMGFDEDKPFEDPEVRRGFIRRTYSILLLQLVIMFGWVAVCSFVIEVKVWIRCHPFILFIFLGMYLVVIVVMCCFSYMMMYPPYNYGMISLVTIALTGSTGCISSVYAEKAVAIAIGATIVVVAVLTALAFLCKYDFTGLMGVMTVLLLLLMIFGMFTIFLVKYIPQMQLIYSCLGTVIFSVFLVMDTQSLMSGKRYSLRPDMHVFAATLLFVDVVVLFLNILNIVGSQVD